MWHLEIGSVLDVVNASGREVKTLFFHHFGWKFLHFAEHFPHFVEAVGNCFPRFAEGSEKKILPLQPSRQPAPKWSKYPPKMSGTPQKWSKSTHLCEKTCVNAVSPSETSNWVQGWVNSKLKTQFFQTPNSKLSFSKLQTQNSVFPNSKLKTQFAADQTPLKLKTQNSNSKLKTENSKLKPQLKNSKTQKLKNSKTQKLKNSKTQKLKTQNSQLKNSKLKTQFFQTQNTPNSKLSSNSKLKTQFFQTQNSKFKGQFDENNGTNRRSLTSCVDLRHFWYGL